MKTKKTPKKATKSNLRARLVAVRQAALAKFSDRANAPRIITADDRRADGRRIKMETASRRLYHALRQELASAGIAFEADGTAQRLVVRIPA
jgi:hypothetical protein